MPRIIEIDATIKDRCIAYAKQIAIYRGYTFLVNGLQEVDGMGLLNKHDHEWLEFREAFAQKSIAHQYHEAADIYYYANQLETQTGESWIPADLHSLRNTYGLDPSLVQKCAEVKYAWRSAATGNKDESYELGLIEKIIG
jgi:hypothetical protein